MLSFRIVDHVKVMNQERDEHILIDYNLLNIFNSDYHLSKFIHLQV